MPADLVWFLPMPSWVRSSLDHGSYITLPLTEHKISDACFEYCVQLSGSDPSSLEDNGGHVRMARWHICLRGHHAVGHPWSSVPTASYTLKMKSALNFGLKYHVVGISVEGKANLWLSAPPWAHRFTDSSSPRLFSGQTVTLSTKAGQPQPHFSPLPRWL